MSFPKSMTAISKAIVFTGLVLALLLCTVSTASESTDDHSGLLGSHDATAPPAQPVEGGSGFGPGGGAAIGAENYAFGQNASAGNNTLPLGNGTMPSSNATFRPRTGRMMRFALRMSFNSDIDTVKQNGSKLVALVAKAINVTTSQVTIDSIVSGSTVVKFTIELEEGQTNYTSSAAIQSAVSESDFASYDVTAVAVESVDETATPDHSDLLGSDDATAPPAPSTEGGSGFGPGGGAAIGAANYASLSHSDSLIVSSNGLANRAAASPAANEATTGTATDGDLSTTVLVAVVFGCAFVVFMIGGLMVYCCCLRRKGKFTPSAKKSDEFTDCSVPHPKAVAVCAVEMPAATYTLDHTNIIVIDTDEDHIEVV